MSQNETTIGRGQVEPQAQYLEDDRELLTLIEGLHSAEDCLVQNLLPAEDVKATIEYLSTLHRRLNRSPHNLNPVLVIEQASRALRDIAKDSAPLLGILGVELEEIANSLEQVSKLHIGSAVEKVADGEVVKADPRFIHAKELLETASSAHPLDIDQRGLEETAQLMQSIIQNNLGHENLGKEGYVVVRHPDNVDDDLIDSIRQYLISYGTGSHDAGNMRKLSELCGSSASAVYPEWFAKHEGHVTKAGFASLCYHTMVMSQFLKSVPQK